MVSSSTRNRHLIPFVAALTLGLTACAPLYTSDAELSAPRSHDDLSALVEDVRRFQRRMGFEPTRNFRRVDGSDEGYASCGLASPFHLPYSYEDPAIRWVDVRTAHECEEAAEDAEASFATTEAAAGRETPVNRKMLVAPLARLLYVIMHEDCHEQFQLPSGIEEALCNVLAYAAMEQLAEEGVRGAPQDPGPIRLFTRAGAARAQFTRELYDEVAALYAQHENALISAETLLREREALFRSAERRLARPEGALNNVSLAIAITYSRHYGLMQRTLEAFESDLVRTVDFFRRLDAATATRRALNRHDAGHGLSRVREKERVVAEIIERSLESRDMLGQEPVAPTK